MEENKVSETEKFEANERNKKLGSLVLSVIIAYITVKIVSNRKREFDEWKENEDIQTLASLSFYVTEGAIEDPDSLLVVVDSKEQMAIEQGKLDNAFITVRDNIKNGWNIVRDDLKSQINKVPSYLLTYISCTNDPLCRNASGSGNPTYPRVIVSADFQSAVWNKGSYTTDHYEWGYALWMKMVEKHNSDLLNLIVAADDAFKTLKINQA